MIDRPLSYAARLLGGEGDIKVMARGAAIGFSLQVAGAGVAFILQFALAHAMGAEAFGRYTYTISWSGLVSVAVNIGLPVAVLRLVPSYLATDQWARAHGLVRMSFLTTAAIGCSVALLATVVFFVLGSAGDRPNAAMLIGFWLVPLTAVMKLFQEGTRSVRRIGPAYAPGLLGEPLLLIAVALGFLIVGADLSATVALLVAAAGTLVFIVVQGRLFWSGLGPEVRAATPVYEVREWLRIAAPLLLIAGFNVMLAKTDIVMVGAIKGDTAAGFYGVASKTANLVGLVLVAVNGIAAPMFATLWSRGEHGRLQDLVERAAQWIFWPSLILTVVLALISRPVMELFGSDFGPAHWQLVALLAGQLFAAAAGPVGYLMIVTGEQRRAAWVYGIVAAVHVLLNAIAIPLFGPVGAGIATSLSVAGWSLWLCLLVKSRLGLRASIFMP